MEDGQASMSGGRTVGDRVDQGVVIVNLEARRFRSTIFAKHDVREALIGHGFDPLLPMVYKF